jgi:hypothetical protein
VAVKCHWVAVEWLIRWLCRKLHDDDTWQTGRPHHQVAVTHCSGPPQLIAPCFRKGHEDAACNWDISSCICILPLLLLPPCKPSINLFLPPPASFISLIANMSRRAGTTNAGTSMGQKETADQPQDKTQSKQAMLLSQDAGHFSLIRYNRDRSAEQSDRS